jgi:hypothetical protein
LLFPTARIKSAGAGVKNPSRGVFGDENRHGRINVEYMNDSVI